MCCEGGSYLSFIAADSIQMKSPNLLPFFTAISLLPLPNFTVGDDRSLFIAFQADVTVDQVDWKFRITQHSSPLIGDWRLENQSFWKAGAFDIAPTKWTPSQVLLEKNKGRLLLEKNKSRLVSDNDGSELHHWFICLVLVKRLKCLVKIVGCEAAGLDVKSCRFQRSV